MRFAAAVVFFLLGSVLLFSSLETHDPGPPVREAPSSTLEETPATTSAPAVFLMAFIDTSTSDENRSHALVLRSIRDQYESKGVRVIVVQSSSDPGAGYDPVEQLNVRYDWGLTEMTILPDLDGRLAEAYSVREFPTTIVLGELGDPLAVWTGYSPPSVVGPALNRILTPAS